MILKGGWFTIVPKDIKLLLYRLWERLKNRDFEEIDFVKSPPHSLLDFKKGLSKVNFKINKPLRLNMT